MIKWTKPVVTVEPAAEPISLALAKSHLRVTSSHEDTLIPTYIAAARDWIENYCGIAIEERTVTFSAPKFENTMPMPIAPVQSISSVQYKDEDGNTQTLATSVYGYVATDSLSPRIVLLNDQEWPDTAIDPEAVTVTAVVGYDSAPAALVSAMLLMIGHLFDNREAVSQGAVTEVPFAVKALADRYNRREGMLRGYQ